MGVALERIIRISFKYKKWRSKKAYIIVRILEMDIKVYGSLY